MKGLTRLRDLRKSGRKPAHGVSVVVTRVAMPSELLDAHGGGLFTTDAADLAEVFVEPGDNVVPSHWAPVVGLKCVVSGYDRDRVNSVCRCAESAGAAQVVGFLDPDGEVIYRSGDGWPRLGDLIPTTVARSASPASSIQ